MKRTAYRITQDHAFDGQWVLSNAKTGAVLETFDRKGQAEEAREAQERDDERRAVMEAYNRSELLRTLAAELAAELA